MTISFMIVPPFYIAAAFLYECSLPYFHVAFLKINGLVLRKPERRTYDKLLTPLDQFHKNIQTSTCALKPCVLVFLTAHNLVYALAQTKSNIHPYRQYERSDQYL